MLSADEFFDKAEEIERSGAGFYRDASQKASTKKMKRMLLDLAAMDEPYCQFESWSGDVDIDVNAVKVNQSRCRWA